MDMRKDKTRGSQDEAWAPKGSAPCLSFLLMLSLLASVVRVRERVRGRDQVPAGF